MPVIVWVMVPVTRGAIVMRGADCEGNGGSDKWLPATSEISFTKEM
jgi:hypothetical protein